MSQQDASSAPCPWEHARFQRKAKRGLDVLLAVVALIVTSPLLLLVALAIKATSPGPVLFRQKRLGWRGSIFEILKFRTMVDRAWEQGVGLSVSEGDLRITTVGRVLRVMHLDELPQFVNVLKGQMTLVGPRPTLPFHYDFYAPWEKQRVEMPPGITGWAQVNGATFLDWDERIKLDVWYIQNWSLWLDARIVVRTALHLVARVFGKKDAYPPTGIGWTRGRPEDPFTHSQQPDKLRSER